jgi:UDP-N-acetyl-D-glucosamine dehydrogenase
VIGLGYAGLPLVRELCRAGFGVIGFDIDEEKVSMLLSGQSYIGHISADLISEMVRSGRLEPTTDYERLHECDVIIMCVPTPLTRNREPDTSHIESNAREIAARLRAGQLIVLESTTYPGTMDELVKPILEAGSGLMAGRDFYMAFSPERENPGDPDFTTSAIPKVVGGHNSDSALVAEALYAAVVAKVVPVSSMRVAEASKILENIYRAVNIALVNELKVLFTEMGIDVWEVIDAASTKPFGFQPFFPGPGLGGHCIPLDPFYLSWKAREYGRPTRFIELAGEVNTNMPAYVVERLTRALNERGRAVNGSRILVLGVAYKPDVDDDRESPGLKLIDELRSMGADVCYNDPHIAALKPTRKYDLGLTSVELTPELLGSLDCVLIATAHSRYDWDAIVAGSRLVIDTRNATAAVREGRDRIVKA